jgi:hypothetical protein
MSQAIIDFCEGLKTTLLGVEDRLAKARAALDVGAVQVEGEAKKHVEEAAKQLQAFKAHAGVVAQAVRAELPERAAAVQERFKGLGDEAQMALRHATVFMAEAAAQGAQSAAGALSESAKRAQALAEKVRHDTAVTVAEEAPPAKPTV